VFGPLRLVTVSVFVLAAGSFGIAFGPSWPVVLAAATVVGVGFGTFVTMNFLVARVFGEAGPAALNALNAMFGVGAVLGPTVAAPFVDIGNHRPVFAAVGAIAFGLAVYFAVTKRLAVPSHPETAAPQQGMRPYLLPVVGFIVLYFFYMASETSFGNWIPTHLAPAYGPGAAARFTALFWLAHTVGRLAAAPVSLRMSPSRLAAWAVVLGILATGSASVIPIAPIAYVVAGFFVGPVFPSGLAWIRLRFPNTPDEVSSVVLAVGGLGSIAAPPLVGLAVDAFGVTAVPIAITLMMVLAGASTHLLRLAGPRRDRA
jgi:fucose permease